MQIVAIKKSYLCDSRSYLRRACDLLNEKELRFLFYAALELRCGIEARMREYLEVAEQISEKKKQGWRVAELGGNLERAFQTGDKIVEIIIENPEFEGTCKVYYTPVS